MNDEYLRCEGKQETYPRIFPHCFHPFCLLRDICSLLTFSNRPQRHLWSLTRIAYAILHARTFWFPFMFIA